MLRRFSLWVFCLALPLALCCSRCEKDRTVQLAGLVPGDVPAWLVFPDLERTVTDLNALLKKFSIGPAASFLNQGKLELQRLLGFDPLEVKDWKKIGLDPKKGLGLVVDQTKSLVVLGVSNPEAFEAEVKKRMKQLFSAEEASSSKVEGIAVTTIGTRVGDRTIPRLHYALVGGYALLDFAAQDPRLLPSCASLKPEESLAGAKWFADLSKKVPVDADLLLLVNGSKAEAALSSKNPQLAAAFKQGLALTFSAAPAGLSLNGFLGLDSESAKELGAYTTGVADAHLERYLPPDTFLAFKARINPGKLLDTVLGANPEVKAHFDQAFSAAKERAELDVESATVRNLSGNAVVGISLGQPEKINRAIASQGRENIGGAFLLLLWAELKDGAAYSRALEKIVAAAGDRLPASKSTSGPLQVLTFPGKQDVEIHLLHHRQLAGLCLGERCTEAAAAAVLEKGPAFPARLSAEAKRLFAEQSLAAGYLNFSQLTETFSGLDASALGTRGLGLKLILDLAIEPIKNLRELTAVVRFLPDGVDFQGHLGIQ